MAVTRSPDVAVPEARFLPAGFDPTDLEALRRTVETLLARPLCDVASLERWLADTSELQAAVLAGSTRRRIAMTCDTSDAAAREEHLRYERTVTPAWQRQHDRLQRHYLQAPARSGLGERYAVHDRAVETGVALFREENVALEAEDTELRTRYARMTGERTVSFGGRRCTVPACLAELEDPDRAVREQAFRAVADARAPDTNATEALFDEMLALRARIAANAGLEDYRAHAFLARRRFDYGPADCERFHDAVEEVVVPAVAARMERRRQHLGVDTLRPWDLSVDLRAGAPLRPFGDETEFLALGRRLFTAVAPVFGEEFDVLVRNRLLDLMSRPGKATGGYNAMVFDIRLPFIFMNAVGRQRDVRTLLHEGGHAFHSLLTRDEPVLGLARAPIEFCEVASMAMEMFGLERFEAAYEPAEARAAATQLLEERLWIPTWVATVDAFQHWVYTHPGHTREERREQWRALRRRFAPYLDWSGLEDALDTEWHQQLHVFRYPFYYIEYALALVGALQCWRRFREDADGAVADYRAALALGGTRPLPELFAAAGARFAMDADVLREVTGDAVARLERLDG